MLAKAKLVEIKWDDKKGTAENVGGTNDVEVQFNPQTLKLTYSNENKGGEQPGGNAKQFVGSGTSKLAVELLFDTSDSGKDVRRRTEKVAYFIQAKKQPDTKNKRVPPGISFEWGSFIFRGVMDSLQETLDYFSEEGVPLRATLALGISHQDIKFEFGGATAGAGGPAPPQPGPGSGMPGTEPMDTAKQNDSVQKMAGRNGNSSNWKAIAAANNIDNPLRLNAGALVNMNVTAGAGVGVAGSAGVSVGAAAGISAGASVGAAAGISAGASAGGAVGFSAGLGAGVGFGASAGASAGVGFGASAGASAGAAIGAGAGISAGATVQGGFGAAAGIGAGVGASAAAGAGAGASAGVVAGGGFGAGVDLPPE